VNVEVFWWVSDLVTDKLEHRDVEGGRQVRKNLGGKLLGGLEAVPCGGQPF